MNKDKLAVVNYLNRFNNKFENNRHRIVSLNRVYNSNFMYLRYLSSDKSFHDIPYKDIVFNYLLKSEKLYPGSSYLTSVEFIDRLLGNNNKFEKVKADKNLINLEKYFNLMSTKKAADLMIKILKFSGPDAVLSCKGTKNSEIKIVKKNNPLIKVNIHEDFRSIYFSNQSELTKNTLVSVMDAFIERESELIPLIEYAKEQKVPIALFCRGMSVNVISHLKQILLRNRVQLFPYIIKFENEDPFMLKDIAQITGTSIISAETGDSIYKDSVIKSSFSKIRLKPNEIEIFNPNKNFINEINKQLKDKVNSEVVEYLMKRKSRISANYVEVLIPYAEIEILNEIKSLIKCYNHIAVFGLYDYKKSLISVREKEVSELLGKRLHETIEKIGYVIRKNE